MVDYHTNAVCAGLALGDANNASKNAVFDRLGPIASAMVDGLLKPHAESVPFAALPNTPLNVQTLTNIIVVQLYHAEIKTADEKILNHIKKLYDEALKSAIDEARATPTARYQPQVFEGSFQTPLIEEDDWNGTNSDTGTTRY